MNFQNYYQGNQKNFMNTEFSSEDDRQETSNNGTIDIDPRGVSIPEIHSSQHFRRPVVLMSPDQVKKPKKKFSKNLDISSDDQIIKNNFFIEKGNSHYEQESESSEIEKITRIMTNKRVENMVVLEENSQAENTPQSQPPAKIPNFNVLSNFSSYKQNQPNLHTDGSSPPSQGHLGEERSFTEDSQELENVQRIGPRKSGQAASLKSDRPKEVKKPFVYRNFVSNSLFKFEKEKKNTDSNSNNPTTSITVINDEGHQLSRSEVMESYNHRLNDSNVSKRPNKGNKVGGTHRGGKKGKKGHGPPRQIFEMPEFSDREIMEAYSTLDMQKTGAVTAEEMKHFMEVIIDDITDAEIDEMIRMVDPNNTQQVTFEQFYKLVVGQDYNPVNKPSEIIEEDLFDQKRNISTRRPRADSMEPSSRKLTTIRNPADSSRYSASRFSPAKVEGAITGNLHAVKTTSKFNTFFKGNFADDDHVSFEEDADEIDAPLKTFIRQAGLNMQIYMQKYDTIQFSNSNKISKIAYKDFLAFFNVGDEDATRKTFAIISKDKNYIDLRQIFIALSLYFDFDSEQKISLAYDLFDPDGNGCILYLEVMKAFSMFQLREESKRLEKKVKTLLKRRSVMPEDTINKEEFFAACNTFPNLFDV